MNKNEFGQLLKKARVSRNLTQKEAANLLYNSPQTISLWEKGDLDIKLDVLCNFINALKYSFLDFLSGELVDSDNSFNYDNLKLLNNIKKYCKENNITKHDFQKSLDVSKPTFNKIINGTISISLWQYFEFCNHYNLELHKFFIEEKNEYIENEIEEKTYNKKNVKIIPIVGIFLALATIISIVIPVSLLNKNRRNNDISSNPINQNSVNSDSKQDSSNQSVSNIGDLIIEDQPSIIIDNSSKKLVGFDINKEYLINNEDYKIVSDSIDIEKTWYFKNIEIITKAKNHKYKNSEPLNLFINPLDFDNYFDESLLTNVLPNGSVDSELEDKINLFSSSYSNDSSHTLSNDEQNVLKNNLNVELPYYHDDVFDNYLNLEKFVSSISILDYQILQDGDKDYVLISGVKDNYKNTVSEIFIPKEIESITDIRIDDESFKLIENVQYEKLNTIIFEQKPHYLGDNVFSGLSLNILDFGYIDDLSYSIDFNFQSRTIQEGEYTYTSSCSQAFKGLKHVDKLRLPLKICEDDTAKFYSVLFDTNGKKLIEYSDDEFGGFNALVLPRPKEGTYKYYAKKIANMKISSLYIPKNIEFYPEFNKDLYLRLVQFEKGYSFLKNEKEYLGNSYYYFIECYALQYYIRDIIGTYDIPKKFMRGNLSFKGQINYENVQSIGSEAFRGTKLPKNISLKNVTSIAEKAFYMPFGLEQIDIYKSDATSSLSPLEIGKNCFINQENSSFKIKKIVFHNFEENEIKKDSSYKSEDILEEFVND